MRSRRLGIAAVLTIALAVRLGSAAADPERRGTTVPLGLDLYVPAPSSNPITTEKAALGRRLFFETRLSADGRTSCASCHRPERFFTDGRRLPRGVFGRIGTRNAPSILNRAYGSTAFWDGRAASLEDQVRLAVAGPSDLGLAIADAARQIARASDYAADIARAFGDPRMTAERLVQAVATFVRTQLSGDSAYDRFLAGDREAMGADAQRGLALFTGEARCARCHSGPLLSDEEFHNTGVSPGRDAGRYGVTALDADRGRFKTPSLRNVAGTAPYMHDGSIPDLDAVVRFYERGGGPNPNLDDDLQPVRLDAAQRRALVSFLGALSSRKGSVAFDRE